MHLARKKSPPVLPVEALSLGDAQVEQRLLQRELEIARKIQQSLLPRTFPELPGFELDGFCRSARHVGGDFFDVVPLTNGAVLLVVADVMGKGVPAALFAAELRTLLRTMVQWTERPGELLARVNRLMFEELSRVDMFITVQLAVLELEQRQLTLASAGHCPMLLSYAGATDAISTEGLPLGIMAEAVFAETVVPLEPFSCALLHTDGLIEARNPQGVPFGQQRLEAWLGQQAGRKLSAAQLKENFLAEFEDFDCPSAVRDDQTFLLLVAGEPPPTNVEPLSFGATAVLPLPGLAPADANVEQVISAVAAVSPLSVPLASAGAAAAAAGPQPGDQPAARPASSLLEIPRADPLPSLPATPLLRLDAEPINPRPEAPIALPHTPDPPAA